MLEELSPYMILLSTLDAEDIALFRRHDNHGILTWEKSRHVSRTHLRPVKG